MDPSYDILRTRAEEALMAARHALNRELAEYPGPVSGCDAQYNHLLMERQRLSGAIEQLSAPVFIPTPRAPTPTSGVESR